MVFAVLSSTDVHSAILIASGQSASASNCHEMRRCGGNEMEWKYEL